MGATIVVDALWGDAGKGKISAFLCKKWNCELTVRAGTGTNSGHSIYLNDAEIVKMRQLPCGWINEKTQVRVGSGVAIDPEILLGEVERYRLRNRAKIDYRCAVITPEYKKAALADKYLMEKLGCVGSGTGYTRSQFILRKAKQAKDCKELKPFVTDVAEEVNKACAAGKKVLIEGGQATFLSLALSPDYPFTTSDNCTTTALADDVGLNWKFIEEVALLIKAIPSRVGEGPLPFEMSKEEILKKGIAEYGTVTGRFRRKASQIDWNLLKYAVMLNGPTMIGLTYCDHFDPAMKGITSKDQITKKVWDLIHKVERVTGIPVAFIEFGKYFDNILWLREGV